MVKRKKLGIIYSYNESWIAGTYYIENLIHALNSLDEERKPHLTVLSNKEEHFVKLKQNMRYPYWDFQPLYFKYSLAERLINKLTSVVMNKKFLYKYITRIETVFPFTDIQSLKKVKNKIHWIPDFQEHFIPQFFTEKQIAFRKEYQKIIAASGDYLILSSQNAKEHFKKFYPDHKVRIFVLPFAVTHPCYCDLSINELLSKYNLSPGFFISPNQFWKHKNHAVVIEAVRLLKEQGHEGICVAFTGKPNDSRNPGYYEELLEMIGSYKLEREIRFLGFINRKEQLQLMNNAKAIIQPSYFEGWSTVIEDAKAMNKKIIASDIAVHREQLEFSKAEFFNCDNFIELSILIKKNMENTSSDLFDSPNYSNNVRQFGERLLNILEEVDRH